MVVLDLFIFLIPKLSVKIQINSQCYKSQVDTNYLIVLCCSLYLGGHSNIFLLRFDQTLFTPVQTFSLLINWCLIFSSRLLLGPELGLTGKGKGEEGKLIVIWRRTQTDGRFDKNSLTLFWK